MQNEELVFDKPVKEFILKTKQKLLIRSHQPVGLSKIGDEKIEVKDPPQYYLYYFVHNTTGIEKYAIFTCVGLESLYLKKDSKPSLIVLYFMKENYPKIYELCLKEYLSETGMIKNLNGRLTTLANHGILYKGAEPGSYCIKNGILLNLWNLQPSEILAKLPNLLFKG
jgi:hypothetical protein